MSEKKICVVGAGASGLAAVKSLLEEGLTPVCYEAAPALGGLWRFSDSPHAHSSVYRSTVINTSKQLMAFSDLPISEDEPTFMGHAGVLRYLQQYAERFDLQRHIVFNTRVLSVEPLEGGRWRVAVDGQREPATFDAVLVCSGHHSEPSLPDFPGASEFEGRQLHSHAYKDPRGFEDQRVVVVGIGNSAVDIAVELSHHARAPVALSTRSSAWIMGRTGLFGVPVDHIGSRFLDWWLPLRWLERLFRWTHDFTWGDARRFGLRPSHGIFQAHPTVNDALLSRLGQGSVVVHGNVRRIHARSVEFEDGREVPADVIVYATGYRVSFPFLDPGLMPTTDNVVRLYRYVFPPATPTLAFVGLVQQLGALLPVSEMQSRWVAAVLSGRVSLPPPAEQHAEIGRRLAIDKFIWKDSPRHTLQLFAAPYVEELAGLVGCRPDLRQLLRRDPRLWAYCVFGPHLAAQYRLQGPHSWDGAGRAIVEVLDSRYPAAPQTFYDGVVRRWLLVLFFVFLFLLFLSLLFLVLVLSLFPFRLPFFG